MVEQFSQYVAGQPTNMDSTTRSTLVKLVEEHVTALIREAGSVQRHSKRARIHNANVNADGGASVKASANNANYDGIAVMLRNRLHAADINMALQLMGSEKLYGVPLLTPGEVIAGGSNNKRIILQEFIRSEEMPPPPTEVALKYHWLAVDGVQPEIPQNPTVQSSSAELGDGKGDGTDNGIVSLPNSASNVASGAGGTLRINQLQASLLSEELKLYFTRVTTAIENGTPQQQDSVLLSVATAPGLQELVPFFVRYCQKEMFRHINSSSSPGAGFYYDHADHCRTLVRLTRSLLQNAHLHLELHLHELLPALVTCVVAEKLCGGNSTNTSGYHHYHHQHWTLRREAASALQEACQLFHLEYPTLKARILRALCQAIAPTSSGKSSKRVKSLASQYGGIVGITLFGSRSIDTFLLPMILSNWEEWEQALQDPKTSPQRHYEIQVCQQASLKAIGEYLQRVSLEEKAARLSWDDDLESIFYDRLIPLLGEPNEYATCFI